MQTRIEAEITPQNAKNIQLAEEAIKYCRKYIKTENSFTQSSVVDRDILTQLYQKVISARTERMEIHDVFLSLFMHDDHPYLIQRKKRAKIHQVGNCDELSYLAMHFFKKMNIHRAELVSFESDEDEFGDHIFVVLDRSNGKNQINEILNWGEACVIVDVLNNLIVSPANMRLHIKPYKFNFDNTENPHLFREFTSNNKLEIKWEITGKTNAESNRRLMSEFYKKLDLIFKYYPEKANTIKKEINLEELIHKTNFDVERYVDKKIKKFIKDVRGENKFSEILINILADYLCSKGGNGLLLAIIFKQIELIKRLLELGVCPSAQHLSQAMTDKQLDIVKVLLASKVVYVNTANENITPPLYAAAQLGYTEIMKVLLAKGALVDTPIFASFNVLCCQAKKSGKEDIFKQALLANGILLPIAVLPNFTPLHGAIFFGHHEAVKILLDANANVKKEFGGLSCLKIAKLLGDNNIVALIENKIRENNRNSTKNIFSFFSCGKSVDDEEVYDLMDGNIFVTSFPSDQGEASSWKCAIQ